MMKNLSFLLVALLFSNSSLATNSQIEDKVKTKLANALVQGLEEASSKKSKFFEIVKIHKLEFNMADNPHGFKHINDNELELHAPLNDYWKARLDARLRFKLWFMTNTDDFYLRAKKIKIIARVKVERLDDGTVKMTIFKRPKVKFRLRLGAKGFFNNILAKIATPIVKLIIKKEVRKALVGMDVSLAFSEDNSRL